MHRHANGTGGAGLPIGFQKQKCVLRTGLMFVKPDVYGGLDFPLFFAGSAYTKSLKKSFSAVSVRILLQIIFGCGVALLLKVIRRLN